MSLNSFILVFSVISFTTFSQNSLATVDEANLEGSYEGIATYKSINEELSPRSACRVDVKAKGSNYSFTLTHPKFTQKREVTLNLQSVSHQVGNVLVYDFSPGWNEEKAIVDLGSNYQSLNFFGIQQLKTFSSKLIGCMNLRPM